MEDVCPVLVDVNAFYVLAVDVSSQVGAFVDDQAFLALFPGPVCKGGSKEAGADDEIIIFFHDVTILIV